VRLERYKKFFRPLVLLAVSVSILLYSDMSLWILFLLLALFYFAVDVLNVDKSDSSSTDLVEEFSSHELGVLDHYTLDSTLSYGLFVSLRGKPVFVDIKEDRFLEKRKTFARFLSDSTSTLEKNLNDFIESHPEFSSRHIVYIGLHAKELDQGEIFWEPEGYIGLKGLEFLP
jgi:hypothetical protein